MVITPSEQADVQCLQVGSVVVDLLEGWLPFILGSCPESLSSQSRVIVEGPCYLTVHFV